MIERKSIKMNDNMLVVEIANTTWNDFENMKKGKQPYCILCVDDNTLCDLSKKGFISISGMGFFEEGRTINIIKRIGGKEFTRKIIDVNIFVSLPGAVVLIIAFSNEP